MKPVKPLFLRGSLRQKHSRKKKSIKVSQRTSENPNFSVSAMKSQMSKRAGNVMKCYYQRGLLSERHSSVVNTIRFSRDTIKEANPTTHSLPPTSVTLLMFSSPPGASFPAHTSRIAPLNSNTDASYKIHQDDRIFRRYPAHFKL